MDGRLCPWSRYLTWAKPTKQPPCQGRSPGCKPGQRGQTGGTGDGRAGAVHRGDMPSKTNHQLHFFTQNIVCLSVLPLSPVSTSTRQQSILKCFCPLPPTFSFFVHFSFLSYVSINTLYAPSHISPYLNSTPHSICPFWLSLLVIIKPFDPCLLSSF